MYKLEKKSHEGVEFMIIWNTDLSSRAILCLSRGGSLEELVKSNTTVITNLSPLSPKKTYPSSILFPDAETELRTESIILPIKITFECNEAAVNASRLGL